MRKESPFEKFTKRDGEDVHAVRLTTDNVELVGAWIERDLYESRPDDSPDSAVVYSKVHNHFLIIYGDYLEVGVGLIPKAFEGLHEVLLGVVNRKNDGDQWFLSSCVSHSDIYRIVQSYPFVKCYGGIGSFCTNLPEELR